MDEDRALIERRVGKVDETFQREFLEKIRAGFPIIHVTTSEETRAEDTIRLILLDEFGEENGAPNMPMNIWDVANGWQFGDEDGQGLRPDRALEMLRKDVSGPFVGSPMAALFRDLQQVVERDVIVARTLRELHNGGHLSGDVDRLVILVGPPFSPPEFLRELVTDVEFPLPGREQMNAQVELVLASAEQSRSIDSSLSSELREAILGDMMGLTALQGENTLAVAVSHCRGFTPDVRTIIKREKAKAIRESSVLRYIDQEDLPQPDEIGGYHALLDYISRRKSAYSPLAEELQIDSPKGIVLMGVPGTGKSYVARAIAGMLELPLYIFDVGAVFRGIVGASEEAMRDVRKQVDAQCGCVLLVDEADKAFANALSNRGDSGVSQRVFGQFLTWMGDRDRRDPTFVVMTLNRTDGLPPEFLRAGRFDAIFSVDLPTAQECDEILQIHFRKRGIEVAELDIKDETYQNFVSSLAGEYVGSEIEQIVSEAISHAFHSNRIASREDGSQYVDVRLEDLTIAKGSVIPLIRFNREGVERIRTFCKDKTRPVTSPQQAPLQRTGRALR